jgi:hypothetical protein
MVQRCHDRVKETTTTTGTGTITLLGAVSQFQAFQTMFVIGEPLYYCIVGQTGTEWEVGRGTLLTTSTLERTVVFESSNANALVNFSAGTKDIFSTIPAERIEELYTKGQANALARGLAMP